MNTLRFWPAGLLVGLTLASPSGWTQDTRRQANEVKPQNTTQGETKLDPAALQALKAQIDAIKAEYEKRIKDLEDQVERLQLEMLRAAPEAEVQAQASLQASYRNVQSIPGALNPAISVVGNFVGRGDSTKVFNEDGDRIDNKLNLR